MWSVFLGQVSLSIWQKTILEQDGGRGSLRIKAGIIILIQKGAGV